MADGGGVLYRVAMKAPARPYHHGNLREALLAAAERKLEAGGAAGLTLREISRELGVSHTSPRHHFADKRALLDALAQRGWEKLAASLERAIKDRAPGFDALLVRVSRAQVAFASRHPALLALMMEAKFRADAPAELWEASERALAPLGVIFAEGQASGAVVAGEPMRLSLVGWLLMQGLVAFAASGKFKGGSLDAVVEEMTERIILGLRPRA